MLAASIYDILKHEIDTWIAFNISFSSLSQSLMSEHVGEFINSHLI